MPKVINIMHALAVRFLESRWPACMSEWEQDREHRGQHLDPARAVSIAKANSVRSILPLAFYELHTMLKAEYQTIMSRLDVHIPLPDLNLLSADDLRRLIKGGAVFDVDCKAAFARLESFDTSSTCASKDKRYKECVGHISEPFAKMKKSDERLYEYRLGRPFVLLRSLDEGLLHFSSGLCKACVELFQARAGAEKYILWKTLPKAFDLIEDVGEDWGTK
ncbi:unnamed protein product [Peniophora sp. CBMAI 1063]|nr:unnamed protein product [Peniophora sp. CBMAI 1063]